MIPQSLQPLALIGAKQAAQTAAPSTNWIPAGARELKFAWGVAAARIRASERTHRASFPLRVGEEVTGS